MPLVQTRGAASAQGFGEFAQASAVPNYIEEVFYTYLRPAQGGSITYSLPSGVDFYNKGGIVWIKSRSAGQSHAVMNPNFKAAGGKSLQSNTTAAFDNYGTSEFAVNSGNTITMANGNINDGSYTYVDWTFVKQPKFFDIVTYTGTGSNTTIAHSLGSVPGSIIVKRTDTTAEWAIYHRSLTSAAYSVPFSVLLPTSTPTVFNSTAPTSAVFSVGTDATVNASGGTYVAYLFAHDSGGFGLAATDNVISCGSFTTNSAGEATVNLGYEPQWILMKRTNDYDNWYMIDNMRGWLANTTSNCKLGLYANSSGAEAAGFNGALQLTSTGFKAGINTDSTFIYIAIRRGPMKVPTSGTSVYNAIARTGTGATANVTGVGFPVDLNWSHIRDAAYPNVMDDRLRGATNTLKPSTTDGEAVSSTVTSFASMDGVQYGTSDRTNASGNTYINWYFKRAPGFFDEVCYTGTGVAMTVTHNLGVVPEMMIVKSRSNGGTSQYFWAVYVAPLGNTANLDLSDTTDIRTGNLIWNNTSPTSSVFTVGQYNRSGASGVTYVAYLFATLASVSKVGSYTGTGALQTVNCGFTSGARFVLIKRSDSTGDWYIYDSVRGITSGNDPYLFANGPDAVEVTGTNYVDTDTTGFKVTAAAPAGLNANGGTYIFLAIA